MSRRGEKESGHRQYGGHRLRKYKVTYGYALDQEGTCGHEYRVTPLTVSYGQSYKKIIFSFLDVEIGIDRRSAMLKYRDEIM